MKIYRNSILTLKVASCEECPHKKTQRHKTLKRFSTSYVCSAIKRLSIHSISSGNTLGEFHPPISEARFNGGFLYDCPLEGA